MSAVVVDRAQLEAMMRMLVDSGDMTPMATRQLTKVLDAALPAGVLDGMAMQALWQIVYHSGWPATLRIRGTHGTYESVEIGEYVLEGEWPDIARRLIEWEHLAMHGSHEGRMMRTAFPGPPA